MAEVRAWAVNDWDRDCGVVVFADTRGKARSIGAGDLGSEFTEVDVKRAPDFDEFLGGKIPTSAYLKNGWWQLCKRCNHYVRGEDEGGSFISPSDDWAVCAKCAGKDPTGLVRATEGTRP